MKKIMKPHSKCMVRVFILLIILIDCLSISAQKVIKYEVINGFFNVGEYINVEKEIFFYDSLNIIETIKKINTDTFIEKKQYRYIDDSLVLHGQSLDFLYGKVFAASEFKNGYLDGYSYVYYGNGNLRSIVNYNKGYQNGNFIEFYENGSIKISGNYKNGKKVGIWKYYYNNGYLQAIGEYSMEIGLDTNKYNYYSDICLTDNFTDNKQNIFIDNSERQLKMGVWKFYNCDGILLKKIEF